MRTHRIVFQHTGEISYTAKSPVAVVVEQTGDLVAAWFPTQDAVRTIDLKEKTTALVSSDMWEPITVDKWAVGAKELPDWMDPRSYVGNTSLQVGLKWFVGFGGDPEWPRQWFERLTRLGERSRFAAIKLLNVKKFRSTFRQSLRSQLEAWLDDPRPQHESPFSPRQWAALIDVYTERAAESRSRALYLAR